MTLSLTTYSTLLINSVSKHYLNRDFSYLPLSFKSLSNIQWVVVVTQPETVLAALRWLIAFIGLLDWRYQFLGCREMVVTGAMVNVSGVMASARKQVISCLCFALGKTSSWRPFGLALGHTWYLSHISHIGFRIMILEFAAVIQIQLAHTCILSTDVGVRDEGAKDSTSRALSLNPLLALLICLLQVCCRRWANKSKKIPKVHTKKIWTYNFCIPCCNFFADKPHTSRTPRIDKACVGASTTDHTLIDW